MSVQHNATTESVESIALSDLELMLRQSWTITHLQNVSSVQP